MGLQEALSVRREGEYVPRLTGTMFYVMHTSTELEFSTMCQMLVRIVAFGYMGCHTVKHKELSGAESYS